MLRAVVIGVVGTLVVVAVVGVEVMAVVEVTALMPMAPQVWVFKIGWLSIANPLQEIRFARSPTIGFSDGLGLWAMLRLVLGAQQVHSRAGHNDYRCK